MTRALKLTAVVAAACFGSGAFAADAPGRAASPRRLLIACMNREMSASRTLSYNAAAALCKAHLKAADATLASAGARTPGALGR
jgi:hypothetical protein